MFTSPLYLVSRNPRSSGLGTIIYRESAQNRGITRLTGLRLRWPHLRVNRVFETAANIDHSGRRIGSVAVRWRLPATRTSIEDPEMIGRILEHLERRAVARAPPMEASDTDSDSQQ
jgi:hypothetical protein